MEPHLRLHLKIENPGRGVSPDHIVSAIESVASKGEISSGSKLPPVRVLAHQLGASKNTVAAAYDELVARGVLESRPRRGYYLCSQSEIAVSTPDFRPPLPQMIAPELRESTVRDKDIISLGNVFIDPDLLPRKRLSDCFRSILNMPGIHTFYDAQGYLPLREAIADRLTRRGIPAEAQHIIVTTGSQQALDIVCRALSEKRIVTENPAYSVGKRLFQMSSLEVLGLPFDPFDGIDIGNWQKLLSTAKPSLLYLTTNFQNPTGYSYSTEELLSVLRLAQEHGFGILEDDWGSDMLSFSEFRPPLRALGGENVLYMNSFTKKLLPSLRLGYLLANDQTVGSLVEAKRVSTLGNPTLIEAALFEFLDRGYFDTHLQSIQEELDTRYQLCLDTLRDTMPDGVRWTSPGGGPILWLELPQKVDLQVFKDNLAEKKVHINLADEAFFSKPHLHGLRIGFAYPKPDKLVRGLTLAAHEIRRQLEN